MICLLLLFFHLVTHEIDAVADCRANAHLRVYNESVDHKGIQYFRTVVNRSAPVQVLFSVLTHTPEVESITWLHNDAHITLDENPKKDAHYNIRPDIGGLLVELHVNVPSARVTGNWTLNLKTTDSAEHTAICFIESSPIFHPKLGAVRANEGDSLAIPCELDSYPPPMMIEWKRLVNGNWEPFDNATFHPINGVPNSLLQWNDATEFSGFYLCRALSPRGFDNLLLEVRIKGKGTYIWPCVGIVLELIVLIITIAIYEHAQAKRRKLENQPTFVTK